MSDTHASAETCIWTQMDNWEMSDSWDTSCGSAYTFDGHPITDHEYGFCPSCGKPIQCVEAKREPDDNE